MRKNRDVQLCLVFKVSVEGSLGDAGALGNFVEVHLHEAVAKEDLFGAFQDAPPDGRLFLGAPRRTNCLGRPCRLRTLASEFWGVDVDVNVGVDADAYRSSSIK